MNNPSVKKTMSTRAQMLLAGGMTIVVGFAATIGLLSWQSSKAQNLWPLTTCNKLLPAMPDKFNRN